MKARTQHFEPTAGYRVIPMHARVESSAAVLGNAFSEGLTAQRDPNRPDFYMAEIGGVSYYFHVFQARQTAYLLSAELTNGLALSSTQARATAP
jgi:hypothetical protein